MGNTQSDGLLALLLSELQEDDGISALDKERDLEEKVLRQARAEKREIITKTKYGIDSNNNFVIIMECGAKPELKFALKVDVEEITSLSYKESKCIRDCLKLGERGTKINEANFTQWVDILKCKYSNVVQGDRDVFKAITIRPENANRNFEAGKIHGLALSVDNDGDFCAKASTNTDTFIVIVQHKVLENSSAQLQGKALADVLHILEPGDRMDKAIFARYCEKLKQKYNIIKMGIHDGCPAAYIVPSRLSPQDAGVNLGAVSDLRNSGRAIAEAAVAAAAAAGRRKDHEGVTCDGCGIINFPGKSFKCQVCENYDLCEECKLSCISTKGHNNNHQMQETIPSQDALNELLIQLLGVAVAGAAAGDKSNHGGRRAVSDDSHKAPKDPTKVHKYGHNGCFRATKLLKESGQANVYLGKQNNSQDVVLKIYHKTTDWDDCSKEVIRLMELPEHDHVIRVLDFFEEPKPCVVMPFIAGCDLMDYIEKNGPMDEFSALIVLTNIAKGLRHLHLHHVIHKDMKSPNILIELPQFRVVLIDLGMGEYIGNDTHELQADQPEGTLLWMAPEMMVTGKYNEKLDIYALGIIMWEVLSGKTPYHDVALNSVRALIVHVAHEAKRPNMDLLVQRNVSGEMRQLIEDCWHPNPEERPTAHQLYDKLVTHGSKY